jgi:glycosyltransferase involved in cell wall biosynthesis
MIATVATDLGGSFDGVLDYSRALGFPLFVLREGRWDSGGVADHLPDAIRRADTVLVQYSPANWDPAVIGMRVTRIARELAQHTRVVLVVHEIDNLPSSTRSRIRSAQLRLRLLAARRHSHAVIATTRSASARLGRWLPRRPTFFVPVGSNLPDARALAPATRTQMGDTPVIATLTARYRLHPAIEPALQAAAASRQVTVLNLGADPAPLSIPDARIHTPGPLPAGELATNIAAADVFIAAYPDGASTRRGSLIAALRQATPVVANRGSATDETLASGVTLADDATLSDALLRVLDLPDRSALAASARELYERSFTWDRVRQDIADCVKA